MTRAALLVALMLAVAGCSQASYVPLAPPVMDEGGKNFAPPPPGMGAVYFFNPTSASPVLNVRANGREIGRLGTQTWMRAEFGAAPTRSIAGAPTPPTRSRSTWLRERYASSMSRCSLGSRSARIRETDPPAAPAS